MRPFLNKIVLISILFLVRTNASAQLQITETNNGVLLAQKLVGPGVTISNVTLTLSPTIIPTGIFINSGGTNIGIDSGVVITCGRAKTNFVSSQYGVDGNGTFTASSKLANSDLGLPGDLTLANALGVPFSQLHDAIALEFDFVPLGDSIKFNYIMSSEEYTVATVCIYPDAFGFFISGPGIIGSKNIALIPGTSTPVTITNVNNIIPAGCVNNRQYYIDNTSNTFFTHEGHTRIFTAISQVQPCETYHLKLVVSDLNDHLWDTGVFLEAGSLTSNAIGITNQTQTDPSGNSYLVEGCATGAFVIRRPRKDPTPLNVTLSYTGTATNGVDVQMLPTLVTIPANDSFVVVNVLPIVDGLPEGIEVLKIYALAGCAAGLPTDSTTIQLRDYDILSLTPDTAAICRNGSIQLIASTGYSIYQWDPDPTLSNTTIRNPVATPVNSNTTYICTATEGTCHAKDSVFIKLKELEFISKTDVNCKGGSTGNIKVAGGGEWNQPVEFSLDGSIWQADSNFYNLPVGVYWVKIRDAFCIDSIPVTVNQAFPDLIISNIAVSGVTCTGTGTDGVLTVSASGGSNPILYSVDGINFQVSNQFLLATGNYTVSIKDNNGCTNSQNATIPLDVLVTLDATADTSICEGTSYLIPVISNADTFSWTPSASLDNSSLKTPTASPVVTTMYYVIATTGICTKTDSIKITVKPAPVANAGADISVCFGKTYQLNGSGGISYHWSPSTYFITSPNIASPSANAKTNITYFLTVTNAAGCNSITPDAVDVKVISTVKIFAGNDTVAAINQPIQLKVIETSIAGVTQYSWSPGTFLNNAGIANPVAILPFDYRYIIKGITAEGCEGYDDILIKVYKGPEIYVPSGFTPNNDGLNDLLKAIPVGIKEFRYFRIYNRWGQMIFSTRNPSIGWDGKMNGTEQPSGTFVWMAEAIDYKGNLLNRKGVVTIVR
ncbi:MAG TPA: choice-of-anchor L domain-containing protein [Chitinophagaceae bacterium]|nr:choice-of-anchor L domain-containing protein [Chitinophagaceae bacterium]